MNTVGRIVEALKNLDVQTNDRYIAAEWIEAAGLIADLDPPVVLEIPFCVYDLKLDEHGVVVLQKEFDGWSNRRDLDAEGNIDPKWKPRAVRFLRYDVFAILAWMAIKREKPETTLEEIRTTVTAKFLDEVADDVFDFWGVDMKPIRKLQAEQGKADQEEEDANELDGEDIDPFVLLSSDRPEESAEQ